jgi:hypothetical protein
MISNIDPIIDRIISAAESKRKEITINEFISPGVQKELRAKGYNIFESGGAYTIKW